MARWWQTQIFFNKFIPKIGEDDFQFDDYMGWYNNQLVMAFVVRFTNLLHQPPLRRRPQQRILEKLARLATLAEVPMKAVTENELEHLGERGWWGGKGRGIFNGS